MVDPLLHQFLFSGSFAVNSNHQLIQQLLLLDLHLAQEFALEEFQFVICSVLGGSHKFGVVVSDCVSLALAGHGLLLGLIPLLNHVVVQAMMELFELCPAS